jgi:hypothetical protein
MYLIYQFTKLIDLTGEVSRLAGYTARIFQLIEAMDYIRILETNLEKKLSDDSMVEESHLSKSALLDP